MRSRQFSVEFTIENAAFEEPGPEIARILEVLANRVRAWSGAEDFRAPVMDYNGNKVGEAGGDELETEETE